MWNSSAPQDLHKFKHEDREGFNPNSVHMPWNIRKTAIQFDVTFIAAIKIKAYITIFIPVLHAPPYDFLMILPVV